MAEGGTFVTVEGLSRPDVTFAFVFRNPSSTWTATNVKVTVTLSDASGDVMDTEEETLQQVLPDQTTAFAEVTNSSTDLSSVSHLHYETDVGRWVEGAATGDLRVTDVETTEDPTDISPVSTLVTVLSSFGEELTNVPVAAVYYDASGKVIGGASGCIEFVHPGETTGLTIRSTDTFPDIAKTEAYWAYNVAGPVSIAYSQCE